MRVIFGRPVADPPTLFAHGTASGWQDAAEAWAEIEGGLVITRWRIDQRFAVGPQWYAVAWTPGEGAALGVWTITPEEDQAP